MKSFIMGIVTALLVVTVSGCCSKGACPKGKEAEACKKACPKAEKCTMPCKKAKKCPFTGTWEFFISRDGKLTALPVDHSPKLELCKKGAVKFHYVKEGKEVVVEGKWKVADGRLVISDASGKYTQYYTIKRDGSAEFIVGKNDRLPENTTVVIRKVK